MTRPPLNSAAFNIREIVKQLLLLEDHLADKEKFCVDCIRKHLLLTEALAEEAMTMDPHSHHRPNCEMISRATRAWMIHFSDKKPLVDLSVDIRRVRKKLTQTIFDPRI